MLTRSPFAKLEELNNCRIQYTFNTELYLCSMAVDCMNRIIQTSATWEISRSTDLGKRISVHVQRVQSRMTHQSLDWWMYLQVGRGVTIFFIWFTRILYIEWPLRNVGGWPPKPPWPRHWSHEQIPICSIDTEVPLLHPLSWLASLICVKLENTFWANGP